MIRRERTKEDRKKEGREGGIGRVTEGEREAGRVINEKLDRTTESHHSSTESSESAEKPFFRFNPALELKEMRSQNVSKFSKFQIRVMLSRRNQSI